MSEYFVAGGLYQSPTGKERFDLVPLGPGEPQYVTGDGVMWYFKLIWENSHLYRVEEDYTLVLVAPSPEALNRGIKAPQRVTPDPQLLEKLQASIRHHPPPTNLNDS